MGPNTQGIHHPSGPHGVAQMQNGPGIMNTRAVTMQQQQQAHMVGPARGQSPHQQVHQVGIVGPGQGGPRIQAPPNMTSMPNMGQIGASSPYYGNYINYIVYSQKVEILGYKYTICKQDLQLVGKGLVLQCVLIVLLELLHHNKKEWGQI